MSFDLVLDAFSKVQPYLRCEFGDEASVVIDGRTFTLHKFLDEYAGITAYLATLDGRECVIVRKSRGSVWWYWV